MVHVDTYAEMVAWLCDCCLVVTSSSDAMYCIASNYDPGCLFLSSNFSPWPLNETGNYTRPAYILVAIKVFWVMNFNGR